MYSMVLMAALTTGSDLPDFGRRGWGCCGCYGGYGWGGWGRGYGGYGWGGWGGGWGGWGGGWGGWGGMGYVYAPVVPTYAAPTVIVSNPLPAATAVTRAMYYDPTTSASKRATVLVHVPAGATLTVDGKATSSTSSTRRFYSPPLQVGKSYHYVLEARMERDGKTVKAQKRVEVCAGDQREITIVMPDLDRAVRKNDVGERQVRNAGR